MLARTPHTEVVQVGAAGTANVHHVAGPSGSLAPAPVTPPRDCRPCSAVSIPSEKAEPSGPGSLTAVPDSPARHVSSQAETVNEFVLSITGPLEIADWPTPPMASAPPRIPRVQPAPCW